MYDFLILITSILFLLFTLKNLQLVYLLNKLGFYRTIVNFMLFELVVLSLFAIIPLVKGLSMPFLVFFCVLLSILNQHLYAMTKKKHNPEKRKTKPKNMSEAEWLWLDYTYTPLRQSGGSDSSGSVGGWWGDLWGDGDGGGDSGGDGGGGSD